MQSRSGTNARDLVSTHHAWFKYVRLVREQFSLDFWKFFLPLHTFARVTIDAALSAARKVFVRPAESSRFPNSKRVVIQRISKVPSFWPFVMCSAKIDLSKYDLPTRLKQITFEFVDPLWAWVCAARRQNPEDMQWVPKVAVRADDPHDLYYGGGVQFGQNFATASSNCPPGAYSMFVELHWDGAHAHGLHATPICVGVGNTNSCSSDTKFCIAYLPGMSTSYTSPHHLLMQS